VNLPSHAFSLPNCKSDFDSPAFSVDVFVSKLGLKFEEISESLILRYLQFARMPPEILNKP